MAISPTKLAQVKAYIVQGLEVREIADLTKVARATVYNIKNEMVDHSEANLVTDLNKVPIEIIKEVAKGVQARAPLALEPEFDVALAGIESLQKLETNFHDTMNKLLERVRDKVSDPAIKIIDLNILINTTANAHKEIFSAQGTTINVASAGDISGTSQKVSMFNSRMGN